jgi:hypothetical protein
MADNGTSTSNQATSNHDENWCDPVVVFDPTSTGGTVAKALNDSTGETGLGDPQQDTTKVDGIRFPVLLINNSVIENQDIIDMELLFINFLPTIKLIVRDDNNKKSDNDVQSMNNIITCIITMPGSLTYKKISLNFYITDYLSYTLEGDPVVEYSGEFHLKDLQKVYHKQIKQVEGSGANSNSLSTYQMFYSIAKEVGLGFAATDQAKGVADNRFRICQAKNYKDFIKEEIEFSGTSESNILDAWIDPFCYINLVNVPYLFNIDDLQISDLTIKTLTGATTENSWTPEQTWIDVYRVITNHPSPGGNSTMMFTTYKEYINNEITKTGASKHFTSMSIKSSEDENNNVSQYDAQLDDKTADGQINADNYTCFEQWFFPGIEMGDANILQQRELRKVFLEKKHQRVLVVTLSQPNLGIQRGTLIYVTIFETNQQKKAELIDALDSYSNSTSTNAQPETKQARIENMKANGDSSDSPMLNFALSDFYYVSGIEFKYKDESIQQILYLMKKGDPIQIRGEYMIPKLS